MSSRTIRGSKKVQTWVVHHNCSNSCNHCFLGGGTPTDGLLEKTKKTTATLQEMGFDTRILPTDQTKEEFAFLGRYAKHSIPNLQVGSRKLDDNLQTFKGPVGVNLMSADPEIHDRLTQKGDHAKAMEIVNQLRERKIPFQPWTTIYSGNQHNLREFFDHVLSLGADKLILNKLIFLGNGMKLSREFFLTSEQIRDVLSEVIAGLREYRAKGLEILIQPTWGPIFTPFARKLFKYGSPLSRRHYCPGGRQLFGVNPKNNGVYACAYTVNLDPLKIGELDDRKGLVLTEEWPFRIDKIDEPCKSCDILKTCGGGCRGSSMCDHLLETGELDFYAGFTKCPVALGVEMPGSPGGAIRSFASFVKHRGIMPHPPK